MERCKKPAKIAHADIAMYNGVAHLLLLDARFDYGGSGQGLGYIVDADFVGRFLAACGKEMLSACVGQVVLVDHDWSNVYGIEPMPFNTGEAFDIEAWSRRKRDEVAKLICPNCGSVETSSVTVYRWENTGDETDIRIDMQRLVTCRGVGGCGKADPFWMWLHCGHGADQPINIFNVERT